MRQKEEERGGAPSRAEGKARCPLGGAEEEEKGEGKGGRHPKAGGDLTEEAEVARRDRQGKLSKEQQRHKQHSRSQRISPFQAFSFIIHHFCQKSK